MTTTLQFLHCTKKSEYLESALKNGLMFTNHKVQFKFIEDAKELYKIREEIMPFINHRLKELGKTYSDLSKENKFVINYVYGAISTEIPMLCFSETAKGKNIASHRSHFGQYGLVVSRNWIEKNGGDRVSYVGESGKFGYLLMRSISSLLALSLITDKENNTFFLKQTLAITLDLLCYIEKRENIEQQEWRIAGKHGLMGGGRSTGQCLSLPLEEIQYVLVKEADEINQFERLIEEKSKKESFNGKKPKVIFFPEILPE